MDKELVSLDIPPMPLSCDLRRFSYLINFNFFRIQRQISAPAVLRRRAFLQSEFA